MSEPQVCVGIDVSKAQLDVALRPTNACWHVSNDEVGIAGLVERLRTVPPTLGVLEATGGLEGSGSRARGAVQEHLGGRAPHSGPQGVL